jgi:hypothetical protein
MTRLHRIAVVGSKPRRYVSGTAEAIELQGRDEALHWNRREAMILTDAFNAEFTRLGRAERFQVEAS